MSRRPKPRPCRAALAIAAISAASLLSPDALARKGRKKQAETQEARAEVAPQVPDDGDSRRFAKGLVAADIRDFSPTDAATGATFVYQTMSFEPDNTWKGSGYIEVMDERMECSEAGHWTMDPAESPTRATVNWTVDRTDCPGREAGEKVRALIELLPDGRIDVTYR